jgi:hypothetical protein
MTETSTLVKKICWAYNVKDVWPGDIQSLARCQKLEDEGFGILADKNNSERMDISDSVVCPDGRVFTPEQIETYWEKKCGMHYSSENKEDVKMHKTRMYYLGFKG